MGKEGRSDLAYNRYEWFSRKDNLAQMQETKTHRRRPMDVATVAVAVLHIEGKSAFFHRRMSR